MPSRDDRSDENDALLADAPPYTGRTDRFKNKEDKNRPDVASWRFFKNYFRRIGWQLVHPAGSYTEGEVEVSTKPFSRARGVAEAGLFVAGTVTAIPAPYIGLPLIAASVYMVNKDLDKEGFWEGIPEGNIPRVLWRNWRKEKPGDIEMGSLRRAEEVRVEPKGKEPAAEPRTLLNGVLPSDLPSTDNPKAKKKPESVKPARTTGSVDWLNFAAQNLDEVMIMTVAGIVAVAGIVLMPVGGPVALAIGGVMLVGGAVAFGIVGAFLLESAINEQNKANNTVRSAQRERSAPVRQTELSPAAREAALDQQRREGARGDDRTPPAPRSLLTDDARRDAETLRRSVVSEESRTDSSSTRSSRSSRNSSISDDSTHVDRLNRESGSARPDLPGSYV